MMGIFIETVNSPQQLKAFIDYPHELYRATPGYVPQLFRQQKELLDTRHSPFAKHSHLQLMLARRQGRIVGRVAAIDNTVATEFHGNQTGYFGFFDCCDDQEVGDALLGAAATWLSARGLDHMRGPVNPDMNNSCGVLIDGFAEAPAIFMPFNAPYYRKVLEDSGLKACMVLNAWDIQSDKIPESAFRYGERIAARMKKAGYTLRPVRKRGFTADMRMLREVYNRSLATSWGATPITPAEFEEQAAGLKMICDNELIQIAEYEGRVVAFIGAAPDFNEILQDIPRGRLWPTGWAKLLWRRNAIKGSRIVMYGVDPDHRQTGLAIWLYITIIRTLRDHGFTSAEASYVLANNEPVNVLSQRLGGQCRKRYAIFEKPIAAIQSLEAQA